ncbi:MAG TPA: GlsB/YeaQ/YmgE family stress response membrane protein [Roseiflexaceae bacterium]|nr:GlsB/YeaQ/YmgE family stress response membrane protein [Roseiflexaceae bacterium]
MGPISWIIFGALAGWVASLLMGTNERQGCLMNIVVGVLGAFLGGLIVQLITRQQIHWGWSLEAFGTAVIGAVILLAITGWGQRRREHRH